MVRYYGRLAREAPHLLIDGYNALVTLVLLVFVGVGAASPEIEDWLRAESGDVSRWVVAIPIAALVLFGLAKANYAEITARDSALAGLQNTVAELREQPAPRVVFHPPRTDDHVPMTSGEERPFVFGRVENLKSHPPKGAVGEGARLSLELFEYETDAPLLRGRSLAGRWRSAPSILQRSPLQTSPHEESIDLRPNGTLYEFDLGMKNWSEGNWYAIDAEQRIHDPGTKRARVFVTVEGTNFDPWVAEYLVESGGYKKGFVASLVEQGRDLSLPPRRGIE